MRGRGRTRDLHVHIPAGATPKDGPSAGIAIACAIVSALTGIPLRGNVAMTGEITLRGRVLGIGGLKEKTVAALRNRISHVILPQENARDLDELPVEVKAGIKFHPVRSMDEVLAVALSRSVIARAADETPTLVAHCPRTLRAGQAPALHCRPAATTTRSSSSRWSSSGRWRRRRAGGRRTSCPKSRSPGAPTWASRRSSTGWCAARRSPA